MYTTPNQIKQICRLWEEGYTQTSIAKHFNLSQGRISQLLKENGMLTKRKKI